MTFVFPSPRICSLDPTFPVSVSVGDTQRSRLSSRYTPRAPLTNLPVPNWQVYSSDSSKHGPVTIIDVPPNMCPRFGRRISSVVSAVEKVHVCLNTVECLWCDKILYKEDAGTYVDVCINFLVKTTLTTTTSLSIYYHPPITLYSLLISHTAIMAADYRLRT